MRNLPFSSSLAGVGPAPPWPRVRGRRARPGFSLYEMLIVLALIGIILAITVSEISRAFKRARLLAVAQEVRAFAQRGLTVMQNQNLQVLLRIEPKDGTTGTTTIELITDQNNNNLYDVGTDVIVHAYEIPADIYLYAPIVTTVKMADGTTTDPLYTPAKTQLGSLYWITNSNTFPPTPDTDSSATARQLLIDVRGRTMTSTATAAQILGIARLALTHKDMANLTLTPYTTYEIRINPLYHVTLVKGILNGAGTQFTYN
jgi:prepilin-type N-terminal cleavage/methylation domain-containing protein